jgi:hypothetical protein
VENVNNYVNGRQENKSAQKEELQEKNKIR